MAAETVKMSCHLCPRDCGVFRKEGQRGFCGMDDRLLIARAALHMWEEPCISGNRGSGAVFFSGCSLRCIFCQNYRIAHGEIGKEITVQRLAEIFLELQAQGAANINLVTAGHYAPQVIEALKYAGQNGLHLPVVYNSSGYETPETVDLLAPFVSVWLPDLKYLEADLAEAYSRAADYPETAMRAIDRMVSHAGPCVFDEDGYIQRGVIVRHLILPGHVHNSEKVLEYLWKTYGETIRISIMNQYTPLSQVENLPPLNRKVTKREYRRVLDYADRLGITEGYFQEGETAKESFIPEFDYTGI